MTQYTLKLSFDLRQITQTLAYEVILPNNSKLPKVNEGPLAGTFNFQQGDKIFVEIVATSAENSGTPKNVLEDFAVTNCTFVSIPARMTEALSLFDETSACTVINGNSPKAPNQWSKVTRQAFPNNTLQLSCRSLAPLGVVTKDGQWKISGYLSVELTSNDAPTFPELYFFDPEGSSGNGGF